AVASPPGRGKAGRSRAEEGIQHGVADKGEHADQPLRQLERVWRRVLGGGSAGDVAPDLAEPYLVSIRRDDAQQTVLAAGAAITAGFPLHENELDVVLDHGVGLVGLAEEA